MGEYLWGKHFMTTVSVKYCKIVQVDSKGKMTVIIYISCHYYYHETHVIVTLDEKIVIWKTSCSYGHLSLNYMFNEAIVAACLFVACVCLCLLLACQTHEFSCKYIVHVSTVQVEQHIKLLFLDIRFLVAEWRVFISLIITVFAKASV